MEEEKSSRRSRGRTSSWFIIVLLIVVVGLGVYFLKSNVLSFSSVNPDSDLYQAVFLTNNQVYFGKLSDINSRYPVLRDIYYLQVGQTLQPIDQEAPTSPTINLIRLGGELHGPSDVMAINREHILFWEDLRSDSQITKAIIDAKNSE